VERWLTPWARSPKGRTIEAQARTQTPEAPAG
jgi:hypothetical protein